MDVKHSDSLPTTPDPEMPLTISPADTSLDSPDGKLEDVEDVEDVKDEKKPAKKRKSWGQELPVPKTNLPPRKRAKTDDEKEQRRIERVLRNRAAAQTSRERKRLEMEKLEGEKIEMEQENQFLLQRLTHMEQENNRLNRQVAKLSAEVRGSRSSSPKPAPPATESPTLTPTLFKQEGDDDDFPLERVRFPTPSATDYSPTLKPSTLAESSDETQHPAAVLCDLQCPSEASKEEAHSHSTNSDPMANLRLHMTLQLLFQTMTFAAYSAVIHPLSQILQSLKTGSTLTFSPEEIYRHFPLILWLISTPTSPPSTASSRPPVIRMRLLARLLACSPALARPLRDATGRALQLVADERLSETSWMVADGLEGRQSKQSLLAVVRAIDHLREPDRRRKITGKRWSPRGSRSYGLRYRVGKYM